MGTSNEHSIDVEDLFDAYDDEKEAEIHRYCSENNLDASDASDYSKAATSVLDYMPPVSYTEATTAVRIADAFKQNSNFFYPEVLSPDEKEEYNGDCGCEDNDSDYGIKDLWKKATGGNKDCPRGTAWIEPSRMLRAAQYIVKSVRPFKKGCYRQSEYAAFYAMNKLAECAVGNRGNVKMCARKYLHFRKEGIDEFRRKVYR